MNTVTINVYERERCKPLTLSEGEYYQRDEGGEHEEGWSRTTETIEHKGDHLKLTVWTRGRDCDGPHQHHWEGTVPIQVVKGLARAPLRLNYYGRGMPDWTESETWQRDVYAERMGY